MADILWLEQNAVRLGTITVTERDMWYFSGTFEETNDFERARAIFEQAYQLNEQERGEDWGRFYEANILQQGFYLLEPSGEKVTEFILYIHEQEAWGRLA